MKDAADSLRYAGHESFLARRDSKVCTHPRIYQQGSFLCFSRSHEPPPGMAKVELSFSLAGRWVRGPTVSMEHGIESGDCKEARWRSEKVLEWRIEPERPPFGLACDVNTHHPSRRCCLRETRMGEGKRALQVSQRKNPRRAHSSSCWDNFCSTVLTVPASLWCSAYAGPIHDLPRASIASKEDRQRQTCREAGTQSHGSPLRRSPGCRILQPEASS